MSRPASRPRRALLAAAATVPLWSCTRADAPRYDGGWVGAQHERGHLRRDAKSGRLPEPALRRRTGIAIVGAGIAGLAAARALERAGITDYRVFDLEDTAGGNSRGHTVAGMACPLGAHYLPVPGDSASEVIELLEAFGLRQTRAGQPVYDERHLCHSPQERLFIARHWHDGLLPPVAALPAAERAATLAQYRRFSAAVATVGQGQAFTLPTARSVWTPALAALDAQTFAQWLDAQRLDAPALRWYLDYCCRDDYGASALQVSAWAGLHYFASRHGFRAPGAADDEADERDGLFTWPEGNAWLSRRLAAPLADRLQAGRVALRVSVGRHETSVDVWDVRAGQAERWTAAQVVLAMPLFIAARLLDPPLPALTEAAATMRHAPWLVGNLHLDAALDDHPGAPPSWDNVVYEPGHCGPSLGYVDAMHQSTRPYPGPTVLTAYWALGGDTAQQGAAERTRLLSEPWSAWAGAVVQSLAKVHPDLPLKLRRVDLMRYGHAMSIPLPGVRSSAALHALSRPQGRLHFAHSDLSAYSVFEEALFHGCRAGAAAAAAARRP